LEGQRQIATAEMERDSAVAMIKAQAASKQLATEVQAKNTAAISDAQSKAQSAKIVAQGILSSLLSSSPPSFSLSFKLTTDVQAKNIASISGGAPFYISF
jgi:hypothetical protein